MNELQPLWKILIWLLAALSVGVAEELFFRGAVANLFFDKHAKSPMGVWTAALWSGLIFGLMHLTNAIGANLGGVLVQVVGVIAIGVAMTAIYYRCRNIWVTVVLHAFMGACGMIVPGLFDDSLSSMIGSYSPLTAITSSVPYIIIAAVVLRKGKMGEILNGVSNDGVTYDESQLLKS